MRHYEIVLLTHPNYEEQITGVVDGYKEIIATSGKVHRFEDWGRLSLAHMIKKQSKAHYFLLNVECDQAVILDIERKFRFNDAVLRYLITQVKEVQSGKSAFLEQKAKDAILPRNVSNNNSMYTKVGSPTGVPQTNPKGEQTEPRIEESTVKVDTDIQ